MVESSWKRQMVPNWPDPIFPAYQAYCASRVVWNVEGWHMLVNLFSGLEVTRHHIYCYSWSFKVLIWKFHVYLLRCQNKSYHTKKCSVVISKNFIFFFTSSTFMSWSFRKPRAVLWCSLRYLQTQQDFFSLQLQWSPEVHMLITILICCAVLPTGTQGFYYFLIKVSLLCVEYTSQYINFRM